MEAMWTPQEKAGVQRMLAAAAVGSAHSVRRQIEAIIERTAADELIVAGAIHDHAARLRSYELLAGIWGNDRAWLGPRGPRSLNLEMLPFAV